MKVSIAMATYNGAKFIQEQLDSLVNQARLPDELVVTDDGSSDDTLRFLEKFAKKAPFEVRVFRNESNLGYARNFGRAMEICTGDLVFLCDQDDVWLPAKVEEILDLAKANPGTMLFMNDAELTRGDGTPLGLTKLGQTLSLGLGVSEFTTGCCMAVRKSFLQLALPIPASEFVHDTWLNRLALRLNARKVMPQVLQYYRRHGDNSSNWIASRTSQVTQRDLVQAYKSEDSRSYALKRLKQLECLKARLIEGRDLIQDLSLPCGVEDAVKDIAQERHAVESRLSILSRHRPLRLLPAARLYLQGYYSYFTGWKSLAKDLLYP